jgi:hypothetical protein
MIKKHIIQLNIDRQRFSDCTNQFLQRSCIFTSARGQPESRINISKNTAKNPIKQPWLKPSAINLRIGMFWLAFAIAILSSSDIMF